ncbi:MAG: hypothetical protein CVV51_04405 [Spirochaetae bacterium HGW-Spirochaetae-7]|nr:MAG: hypothetical protein CVV51_04405 [Spirochaetae bacterium HGW-Spirochaetae-7]
MHRLEERIVEGEARQKVYFRRRGSGRKVSILEIQVLRMRRVMVQDSGFELIATIFEVHSCLRAWEKVETIIRSIGCR